MSDGFAGVHPAQNFQLVHGRHPQCCTLELILNVYQWWMLLERRWGVQRRCDSPVAHVVVF